MVWPAVTRYREARKKGGKSFERMGDYLVPAAFVMEVEGQEGAPDAMMRFEVRDGRPECVEISIKAHPDGRGIRTSDMRVFNLDEVVTAVFSENAKKVYPDDELGTRWRAPRSEDEIWAARDVVYDRRTSQRVGRETELERVAQIYREHIKDAPLNAVKELMNYGSERTAARRVQQARAAGLLPKTTRGKRKA